MKRILLFAFFFLFSSSSFAAISSPTGDDTTQYSASESNYVKLINLTDVSAGDNFLLNPREGDSNFWNVEEYCSFKNSGTSQVCIRSGSFQDCFAYALEEGDSVACEYDGTSMNAYVNDIMVSTYEFTPSESATNAGLYVSSSISFDSVSFSSEPEPTSAPTSTPAPTTIPTPTDVPSSGTKIDISSADSPNLINYFRDFSHFLFFLLSVIIFLDILNLLIKMTSHKKDD